MGLETPFAAQNSTGNCTEPGVPPGCVGEPKPSNNLEFLGYTLSVIGNLLISVALNIQKYAHNKNEKIVKEGGEQKHYLRQWTWWMGMLLMAFGEVGNFVAYVFAPASSIAPLGTVALVANAIIAPIALKEKFRRQDLFGIFLAVSGAIVVVIFSASGEPELTAEELIQLFIQIRFLIYLAANVAVGIVLAFLSKKYGPRFIVVDIGLVAIFGGFTVVSTKTVSSLLKLGIPKFFTEWLFYVAIIVLVGTAVMQIRYLQVALQRFPSTQVIPTQFVFFTIMAIIGSAITYGDFDRMVLVNQIMFPVGCVLTFLGVYFITANRASPSGSVKLDDPLLDPVVKSLQGSHAELDDTAMPGGMGLPVPIGVNGGSSEKLSGTLSTSTPTIFHERSPSVSTQRSKARGRAVTHTFGFGGGKKMDDRTPLLTHGGDDAGAAAGQFGGAGDDDEPSNDDDSSIAPSDGGVSMVPRRPRQARSFVALGNVEGNYGSSQDDISAAQADVSNPFGDSGANTGSHSAALGNGTASVSQRSGGGQSFLQNLGMDPNLPPTQALAQLVRRTSLTAISALGARHTLSLQFQQVQENYGHNHDHHPHHHGVAAPVSVITGSGEYGRLDDPATTDADTTADVEIASSTSSGYGSNDVTSHRVDFA